MALVLTAKDEAFKRG